MDFNIQGIHVSGSGRVGGSRPVFVKDQPLHTLPTGALVSNPPALGGMIFAGDVGQFNFVTKQVSHMKTFLLAKAITAEDTTVYVKRGDFYHVLESGLNLMVAPSELVGTGTAITVGTVTAITDPVLGDVYSFTITANALGAVDNGSILVEAVEAGEDKAMLVAEPNCVFMNDIYINYTPSTGQTGAAYPAALYNIATLWGKWMSPMPLAVRNGLRSGYTDIKIFV